MKIRLGYVCLVKSVNLPFKTINFTNFNKSNDFDKLDSIIKYNLNNLYEILKYNKKNGIYFYRMTSNLIPLATLDKVEFDYLDKYSDLYDKIGKFIKDNNMRVDFHPDQFCVINSTNDVVYQNSIKILNYHFNLLDKMGIKNKVLVLHIGSTVFGKDASIKRFISRFNKLDDKLKKCIVLENDDKTYNVLDTLLLCEKLGVPMVLDYHHYVCNKGDVNLYDVIDRVFNTWDILPKIHFSSPKNLSKKDFRSHNDYIDENTFIDFLENIKFLDKDIDIMLEAKEKDCALFRLVRGIKYKTDYSFINDSSFIIKSD